MTADCSLISKHFDLLKAQQASMAYEIGAAFGTKSLKILRFRLNCYRSSCPISGLSWSVLACTRLNPTGRWLGSSRRWFETCQDFCTDELEVTDDAFKTCEGNRLIASERKQERDQCSSLYKDFWHSHVALHLSRAELCYISLLIFPSHLFIEAILSDVEKGIYLRIRMYR